MWKRGNKSKCCRQQFSGRLQLLLLQRQPRQSPQPHPQQHRRTAVDEETLKRKTSSVFVFLVSSLVSTSPAFCVDPRFKMSSKPALARSDPFQANSKLNSPSSFITPSTPRRRVSVNVQDHARVLGLLTPIPSVSSLNPTTPRPRHTRQSPSSSALFFPVSSRTSRRLSLRRSLPRSSPTLALSIQSQPCTPSSKMNAVSRPSSPPSRPLSPRPEYIVRPPSRSESLLRDTLRRVEEYEWHQGCTSRIPGHCRQHRIKKDSYKGPVGDPDEFTDGECECDEDPELHPSKRPGSFDFFFRAPSSSAPRPMRRNSSRPSRSPSDARHYPYGSPSSPSPVPPALPRTRTAPAVPSAAKPPILHVQHAVLTAAVPRQGRSRHSMPNTSRPSDPSSGSHSHSSSVDSSPQSRVLALSPHEAVLRARLEGVLNRAEMQATKEKVEPNTTNLRPVVAGRGTHGRSKSHSVSIVRAQSPHNDWPSVSGMGSSDVSNFALSTTSS